MTTKKKFMKLLLLVYDAKIEVLHSKPRWWEDYTLYHIVLSCQVAPQNMTAAERMFPGKVRSSGDRVLIVLHRVTPRMGDTADDVAGRIHDHRSNFSGWLENHQLILFGNL